MSDPSRSFWQRHVGKIVVSLGLGVASWWLLQAGALPLVPRASAWAEFQWWGGLSYGLLFCAVHVLRAARWHWLLAPLGRVPMRSILAVSFVGFAAIVALPLRTGEVVRPLMIRREGVSGWAATGTIGAERVLDGLVLCLILLVALVTSTPLEPLPEKIGELPVPAALVPAAVYFALAGFACAFVAMGAFYFRRHWTQRLLERVLGWVSPRLASAVSNRVGQVAAGLEFLPKKRYFWAFLAATVGYWLLNAGATWLLGLACGFSMTYGEACVCMGVLALGILMPNAPGYFGAFQISVYAALAVYFPPAEVVGRGAVFVLVMYGVQTLVTVAAGGLGLWLERAPLSSVLEPAEKLAASPDLG